MNREIDWGERCRELAERPLGILKSSGSWIHAAFPHLLRAARQFEEGSRQISYQCLGQMTASPMPMQTRLRFNEEAYNPFGNRGLRVVLCYGPEWGQLENDNTPIARQFQTLKRRFRDEVKHWHYVPLANATDYLQNDARFKSGIYRFIVLMNAESVDSILGATMELWNKVSRNRMKERVALVAPDQTLIHSLDQALRKQLRSADTQARQIELWRQAMDYQTLSTLLYTWNKP